MQEMFNDYLDISKEEEERIANTLKNKKYSRLEISLIHPYNHEIK